MKTGLYLGGPGGPPLEMRQSLMLCPKLSHSVSPQYLKLEKLRQQRKKLKNTK